MNFVVKFGSRKIGITCLEKGDSPMGVAFGDMDPSCSVEGLLGKPLNDEADLKGWEGLEVCSADGEILHCQSTYLEQFDFGGEGFVYQITCFVNDRAQYEKYFQHHITAYENSFS